MQSGQKFPVQVSVDREYIMYGTQLNGELLPEIGMYFPHENKFVFSDHISANSQNSMISYEGYRRDFFTSIWKNYLMNLPIDFESFEVNPFIFDLFSFNETLFFYSYGAFKFKSLKNFKDNFRILRREFYWENKEEAELYFNNLNREIEESSETPKNDTSINHKSEDEISLERTSTLGSQIFRMPSGVEESEDDELYTKQKSFTDQMGTEELMKRFSQGDTINSKPSEEAEFGIGGLVKDNDFENTNTEEIGVLDQINTIENNGLLKEKFSIIEEESQMQEISKDNSKNEDLSTFLKSSKKFFHTKNSDTQKSGYFQKNIINDEFYSKKNHIGDINSDFNSDNENEVSQFIQNHSKFGDQVIDSPFLSSNFRQSREFRERISLISKSLNMQKKNPESSNQVFYEMNKDPMFDSNEVMRESQELKIGGKSHEYIISSGVGFNKYIISSQLENSKNLQITEFETGRMSQKTPSEKILNYKISRASDYVYGDTLEKGKKDISIKE
jgi:hypothetical protein